VAACSRVNELGSHPNLLATRLNAAFEYIADAEIATNGPHVRGLASVNLSRITSDDEQVLRVREVGNDILGNPVGEATPFRIHSNVLERQDRDGSFFR
jgi:hypothetical protein